LLKVVNQSDFQMVLSNELYQNHFAEWLLFKIDCLEESTGRVNKTCASQGITLWFLMLILLVHLMCKIFCNIWRLYQSFKKLLTMVDLKNNVQIDHITPGRKRKVVKQ